MPAENPVHEAPVLRLNADKAREDLAWRPGMTLDEALAATVAWYRAFQAGASMRDFTLSQIKAFGHYE
jgi:CDP-glucose 4,6-dehydratase